MPSPNIFKFKLTNRIVTFAVIDFIKEIKVKLNKLIQCLYVVKN